MVFFSIKRRLLTLKRIIVFLVFTLILGILGSAYAQSPTNGKAYVTFTSDFNTSTLNKDAKIALKKSGWKINKDGLFITFPMKGELIINGEVVVLDDNGTFYVPNNPEFIEVEYNDKKIKVNKNESNEYIFNSVLDFETIWDQMDEQHDVNHIETNEESSEMLTIQSVSTKGYYDKYSEGDWVHCNRFNGPGSDGVHYPKTHWKAYVNFVGSDCQLAVTFNKYYGKLCALDYTSNKWCNGYGGPAACSGVIGHKKTYHKH